MRVQGVYAKRIGNDIYLNMGKVAQTPEDREKTIRGFKKEGVTNIPELMRGIKTCADLKREKHKLESIGYVCKVVKETTPPWGTMYRLMVKETHEEREKRRGVPEPYTNPWLKSVRPKRYAQGWRISEKNGLTPPSSTKPTKPAPKNCMACGGTKFRFTATGLDHPSYWWACTKCGVLHKAR